MTSSACQLGELTTLEAASKASSNGSSVALQVLPFEAWQLVEHEEFDVNHHHSIAACDDGELLLAAAGDQQQQQQQLQQKQSVGSVGTYNRSQTRSGSSDSGQLSLLSSFGSISFGGYHINSSSHQHNNNTNPSSDTASHQSMSVVDIDQHQFYCSLMLLNSLDFCHYEHQKANNKNNSLRRQQQQIQQHQATGLPPASLKTPNLTLSQAELNHNYTLGDHHQHHKGSLQDCHSHCWFPCEKETATKLPKKNISLELDDSSRDKKAPIKSSSVAGRDSNSGGGVGKKRGAFGLSILSGGNNNSWQGQGAGKLVAAAAAATNSSGFVDKLLAHMINRRNGGGAGVTGGGVSANGRSASSSAKKSGNKGGSKHHQETTTTTKTTTTMNRSRDKSSSSSTQKEHVDVGGLGVGSGVAGLKSAKSPIVEQAKKQKTATQSTGGIHLLSDLSRRLARHCGVKTKEAVRFGGSCDAIGGGGGTSSKGVQAKTTRTSESGGETAVSGSFSASLKQSDTFSELWQSSGRTRQQHQPEQQQQRPLAQATATTATTTTAAATVDNTTNTTTTTTSQPLAIAAEPTKFNEQSLQRQQREQACCMDGGSTTTSGGTTTPKSINFISSEPSPQQQQQQQLLKVNPTRLGQHSSHHQLFQVQSSSLSPEHKEASSARASISSFNHIININNNNNVSGNFISSRNNLDELAADSGEGGIRPLDYVARGPFDSYHEDDESHHHNRQQQQQQQQHQEEKQEKRQHLSVGASLDPKSTKSASSSRLLSVASCGGGSSRKLSTKEKCKRQKDAERVEKLRLLVNYLKSGSSQPVVSPVTLEADEIELAEKYKMHVTLRDDMLHDILANDSHNQQHQQQHEQHMTQSVGGSRPNIVADRHNATTSSKSEPTGQLAASGCKMSTLTTTTATHTASTTNRSTISKNNSLLINHSIGGTSASSPVSSSSTSSMNHVHHHSVHDGRSIVRIGDVTWVLRHSISDPGNNFEHSPAFSTASSSPPTKDHKHHLHHHNHLHHHHHHHHRNHSTHDGLGPNMDHNSLKLQQEQSPQEQQQQEQQSYEQQQQHHQQQQEPQQSDLCSSCAPSSGSYSGSSLSNYCLASGSSGNKGNGGGGSSSGCCNASQQQQQQQLQQQQHPQQPTSSPDHPTPKMFYIGDMDMIPVFSPSLLNTSSTSAASLPLAPAPMHQQQQTSTPLTTANSTNCCSQPSTPVIYTNLSTSNINNNNNTEAGTCGDSLSSSNRNSSSTSAWTNPQNLATWIDNEVNSLVHDLEAKSQQLQIKNESKHNKSGKKKWLSVTSSHSKLAQD